eukprot:8277072-Ditylum_brightwellii.AAC.1
MLPPNGKHNPWAVPSAFSRSLQHEWSYLQRVINADPALYSKLDDVIKEELIPSLLGVDVVDTTLLPLFSLLVKFACIGVFSPSTELPLNHTTSINSILHLKQAILQEHQFNSEDHSKCMGKGQLEGQKSKADKYESILVKVTAPMSPDIVHAIQRSQEC